MPALISSPPQLKLDGKALPEGLASRLVALEVVLSTQQPGRATLRLEDDAYELLDGKDVSSLKIGQRIAVSLAEGKAATTEVFDGEIVAIGIERSEGGKNSVVLVEALDGSHRLTAAAHPTTWLDTTTKQVVEAVAGRHKLTPKVEGAGASLKHPYLAQAGTDRALLDALARQIGFEWWTEGKELHFKERPAPTTGPEITRDELVSLSVRYDGRNTPKTVKVTSWDPIGTAAVVGTAKVASEKGALGSTASFVTKQHAEAKKTFGTDLSIGDAPAADAKQAKTMADAIEQELLGDGLRVEGTLDGRPTIRAGGWVTLKTLGTSLDGNYYVSEVRHQFGPKDLMTTFVCAPYRPDADVWRPDLRTPGTGDWGLRGVVPAVVTNVEDPEKLGRVKVKFPSLGDDIESTWARVVAPGAGAERGLDLRPRVDDEVLVAFAHGDQGQPFVLGGVWSAKHKHGDGEHAQTRDAWRSEDGALLTFHRDGEGTADAGHEHADAWKEAKPELKGAVSLRSATKSGVIVGDKVVMATPGKDIVITNGKATITLAESGDITIEGEAITVTAKKTAEVAAQSDATIEGQNVTVKGVSKVTLDTVNTEVKSMAGIKLQSTKVEMGP